MKRNSHKFGLFYWKGFGYYVDKQENQNFTIYSTYMEEQTMNKASIRIESLVIPTYPEPEKEQMPMFAEHRVHQRSTGRPYPNKAVLEVNRAVREDKTYTVVHLENDYLDVLILPEIGGRIFTAQDKSTGYDFFYRQHVIKPGLIGALGSWISGGVEFNWPYHHRASGFLPCDYEIEEAADGSVICWLSEHDPIDRMKGMVGVVLRPDCAYLETRIKLCNRTPVTRSFLWWENAAVPVNESYQIFFPKDVTYVNFHYLDSRISYPVAGDATFNGIDMHEPRDISWHKNTKDATSYFACASKYDFFGGYDHGLGCGVVHIGDHHISPGKKMFTWAYNQLSKTWENTLTDTDGQYAELMAGSYTDNQPNFSWLEPYETKEFSQYWYPVQKIGVPDYANLDCAVSFRSDKIWIQTTKSFGTAQVEVTAGGQVLLSETVELNAAAPVVLNWARPNALVSIRVTAGGKTVAAYTEEKPDQLKKPPVKDPMPLAAEVRSADELYLAGVHVEQYRDPAVMPDVYWLEALKRDPYHADSLLGMAKYCYQMGKLAEAEDYARRSLGSLTKFNMHTQSGDPYFLLGLILEEQGKTDEAYDNYYKASWNGSAVAKAMAKVACIDLKNGDYEAAVKHARQALNRDAMHPLAPVVLVIANRAMGREAEAQAIIGQVMKVDCLNNLIRWLGGVEEKRFFTKLDSAADQTVLDMVYDLDSMGQYELAAKLLEQFSAYHDHTVMTLYTLAYLQDKLGLDCAQTIALADAAQVADAYPVRLGEMQVLEWVKDKGAVKAAFLLGCLLYDKRQYAAAAKLFEESIHMEPDNYMTYRSLAVAYFTHLNRKEEAVPLMEKARNLNCTQQVLYESVILMDLMNADPAEKIALLQPYAAGFRRDDLFVELAKAYNQNGQPQKTLDLLMSHVFVACEGGEHAIADQYMYAYFQMGMDKLNTGDYNGAYETLEKALTLPKSLGSGIWNRCKYVPYQFHMAQCLEKLGKKEQAMATYREILGIEVEFFSNMHLRELPYYQALCAEALGMQQKAWNIMGKVKRDWTRELSRKDNGFFSTTPFFISFSQDPAILRRGYYLYLLGLVKLFEGETQEASKMFKESYQLNSDSMFCHYYAHLLP